MDTWLGRLDDLDYATQWLAALFTEGDNPLNTAFNVFGALLAFLASVTVAWHVISGIVQTAHDGRVLGQKWHQIWAVPRVVIGVSMLVPLPGVGMCAGQLLVREVAGASAAMANGVWNAFSDSVLQKGEPVVPVSAAGHELVRELFLLEACNAAANLDGLRGDTSYPPPDSGGAVGSGAVAWTYAPVCGALRFPLSSEHPEFGEARRQAVGAVIGEIRSVAESAAMAIMPAGNGSSIDTSQLAALVTWMNGLAATYDASIAKAAASAAATVDSDTREKLAAYSEQRGWMTAGLYWRTLSQTSEIAVGLATERWEIEQPRDRVPARFGTTEPSMPDVQRAMTALRAYLDTGASEVRLKADDLTFAGDANADFMTRILAPLRDVVAASLTSDASTDPVSKMMSMGHGLLAGAEVSVAAGAVASAAGTNLVSDSVGLGGVVSWLQPMARLAVYAVGACGVVLAYVLPMMPFIFLLFLSIGWLVFILEAKIAVLIWSFLWCRMDGADLLSDAQRPGAMLLFNLLLRPTLGILALCGSYALTSLTLGFVDETFGLAFAGSQGGHVIGLVGLMVGVGMLTFLQWKLFLRLHELISELPDRVARWFGHTSEGLHESQSGSTIIAGSIGGTTTALQRAAPAPRPTLPVRPSSDPGSGTGGGRSPGSIGGAGRPSGSA
jgi:hypothetical protein